MMRVDKQNSNPVKEPSTMNVFASVFFVLLFLTSTLVHANHLIEQPTHVEQQECFICHQGIDTPPELPHIQYVAVARYCFTLSKTMATAFKHYFFVQPQLRAPPSFQ